MNPFFAFAIILFFVSCSQNPNRNNPSEVNDSTIALESQDYYDTLSTKKQIEEWKNTQSHKLISKLDTIAFNYLFSYKLFESEDVLKKTVVNWLGETEVHHYPEKFLEIELSVEREKVISKKIIEKGFFEKYVIYHKISDVILSYGGTIDLQKDKVVLKLSLCVPDTDDCYMFYLNIFLNGGITIEEKEIDWDFD